MTSFRTPDDDVGQAHSADGLAQTAAQKSVLGDGGEAGGKPEPKGEQDWAQRGATGGEPGSPPVAIGGNSQGQGDRMPTGGATVSNTPASNPKTEPGETHDA